jgi:beta-glucanase (GH16 family)
MATNRHRRIALTLSAAALVGGSLGGLQVAGAGAATASTTTTTTAATTAGSWSSFSSARDAAAKAAAAAAAAKAAATTTVTSAVNTAVSPSGVPVPKGNLPGWRQVYAEDFSLVNRTGTFPSGGYANHWGVYNDGWKDTSKNGTYMPSKVLSTHNGVLDYSIRTENGQHLVAAPWLKDTKGRTYGRYSIRFRADNLPGYKTAWLLWPDSERWPTDGEIDFPEGNLGSTDTIHAFHHFASSRGGQAAFPTRATFKGWHTVTVEWVPGKVTFVLDGKVIGSSTTMVPATAMHWVLQTETNLDGYAPSSAVRGHVLVDWVAFWARA